MKNFTTRKQLRRQLDTGRASGLSVGLVPTMGALHDGHLSLIAQAKAANDIVVCSIFVNPTQFNDPADLEKYPRPLENDMRLLEKAGCDVLFLPEVGEMYPPEEQPWVLDLHGLDAVLEGEHRPGHYAGVTQIVFKLLSLAMPCTAYFGQKDYQQFRVIQSMVSSLDLPVTLQRCAIVRESDGLALSSRNVHLSPDERRRALVLSRALYWLKDHVLDDGAIGQARNMISETEGVTLDYLELVSRGDLQPVSPGKIMQNRDEIAALVAARVGSTRLIDNVIVKPATADFPNL